MVRIWPEVTRCFGVEEEDSGIVSITSLLFPKAVAHAQSPALKLLPLTRIFPSRRRTTWNTWTSPFTSVTMFSGCWTKQVTELSVFDQAGTPPVSLSVTWKKAHLHEKRGARSRRKKVTGIIKHCTERKREGKRSDLVVRTKPPTVCEYAYLPRRKTHTVLFAYINSNRRKATNGTITTVQQYQPPRP